MNALFSRPILVCALVTGLLATGCAHASKSSDSDTQSQSLAQDAGPTATPSDIVAEATTAAVVPPVDESAEPSTTTDDSPAPQGATPDTAQSGASGDCPLLAKSQVEDVLHLSVDTIKTTSTTCDFSFKSTLTTLTIEYDAHDGAASIDALRKGNSAAQSALSGVTSMTSAGGQGSSNLAKKLLGDATDPALPKLGDDQYAFTAGPGAFLGVVKGDAYVQITTAFVPQTIPPWQAESEFVRRTLAKNP